MKHLFFICLSLTIILACTEMENNKRQDILIKKIVETLGDSVIETEIFEYEYKRPDDVFWSKEIIKDNSGEVQRITKRKFDIRTGLPIIELVEEMGEITETYKVIYSLNGGELLLKDEYEGNFKDNRKIKSTKFEYLNGVLLSRTIAVFPANQKFVNNDKKLFNYFQKIKYFPPVETRPKGDFETDYNILSLIEYEDNKDNANYGQKAFEEKTRIDDKGFPVYHSTTQPGCAHEGFKEWYDYELDGKGRISNLRAFDDAQKTIRSIHSSEIKYKYDSKGYIHEITDTKYSPEDKKYTKFHDLQIFGWLIDKQSLCYDYNYTNEHYCFTGQRHSLYQKKVSFESPKKKIVSEYFDAYVGEYKSMNLNPKLIKRTIYFYD